MPSFHPLGDYLRARRELVQPVDVGLPAGRERRKVPGLRRSEVASIAGISTEYYIKLEQGQEKNPTAQVLDSLSSALKLDATANSYLHSLARLGEVSIPVSAPLVERSRWLIESWPTTAAIIHDPYYKVLAVNSLMRKLVPAYREGGNTVEALLLDPSLRELHGAGWDGLTSRSVALLRMTAGLRPDEKRFQELVARLTRDSERFRELWHRNDVLLVTEGVHHVTHPELGPLSLQFARLPLGSDQESSIFLYYAEPGTRSAEVLAELAAGR